MDLEHELMRLKQRFDNFGLLRFGAVCLAVVSFVGLFAPEGAGWGTAGVLLGLVGVGISNAGREACAQRANAMLVEFNLFHTPEGRQAIQDEAARRLREHDY
ncbi:MAG: hypothetical protein IR160_04290 [Salinibacterium sp.]|nr:hypothetical protein [Salinibacterium sp.]MBF0671787.1 hypothetical protein [Salinibacterium sp.]